MTTGCGVNVSNQYPTMSINDCITLYNREHGTHLPLLTVESVLASTFNTLESLLSLYQVQGLHPFLHLYYKYWLHRSVTKQLSWTSERAGQRTHSSRHLSHTNNLSTFKCIKLTSIQWSPSILITIRKVYRKVSSSLG